MECSLRVRKEILLGASLLSLALPASALAGSITIVSEATIRWDVYALNADGTKGPWLGFAQNVCLNTTSPSNCPLGSSPAPTLYGYAFNGWTADLSSLPTSARWIWAPKITGASSPAALQGFIFETEFYVCDPAMDGTISVAVDNSAEVSINGTTLANSASSQSALTTLTIPLGLFAGSSITKGIHKNYLTVKASNAANPADCQSDQYGCNPAGLVLGATMNYSGDPPCGGFKGGTYTNGQEEILEPCPPGKIGRGVVHQCVCGQWRDKQDMCVSPPPTCTGNDGKTYGVGEREALPCPAATPNGTASRTCLAKDTWGNPDNSPCMAGPATCTGKGGGVFAIGQKEDLGPCPTPKVGTWFQTCQPDGSWTEVDMCHLPKVCVGEPPGECMCANNDGPIGECPPGVECLKRPIGDPAHPSAVSADSYCGSRPPRPLGQSCNYNAECASRYCDRGDGTSKTGLCMPRTGTGTTNDWCSNNNQCASGRCGGLRQDFSGAWQPGHCSSNTKSALGDPCSLNSDCTSNYCDRGDGTSKTSLCMPRGGAGSTNDWCSNNNQCSSGRCGGLQQDISGAWQPGHCSNNTKSALGASCSVNSDCTSSYCDRGDGTSKTSMCMPWGPTGLTGEWCSNNNQCVSRVCGGLERRADGSWKPGHCN